MEQNLSYCKDKREDGKIRLAQFKTVGMGGCVITGTKDWRTRDQRVESKKVFEAQEEKNETVLLTEIRIKEK